MIGLNKLFNDFYKALRTIGMKEIVHPIFYNAPTGIRFEIGGNKDVYLDHKPHTINPKYVAEAMNRAKAIYTHLSCPPDVLRIDGYPNERISAQGIAACICETVGMPQPHEKILTKYRWSKEDEEISQLQLYWNIKNMDFFPDKILQEIIRADIGGYSELVSNVYFVDTYNSVLFHMYDDRGADLVAANQEDIKPLFEQYSSWILEYDREKINQTFVK